MKTTKTLIDNVIAFLFLILCKYDDKNDVRKIGEGKIAQISPF
jgi:hypothetical protein